MGCTILPAKSAEQRVEKDSYSSSSSAESSLWLNDGSPEPSLGWIAVACTDCSITSRSASNSSASAIAEHYVQLATSSVIRSASDSEGVRRKYVWPSKQAKFNSYLLSSTSSPTIKHICSVLVRVEQFSPSPSNDC